MTRAPREASHKPASWEHYLELPGKGDAQAVSALEGGLGISLPEDVRQAIIDHAGDAVEPSAIRVGQGSTTTFGAILYAGGRKDHQHYTYSIEWALEALAEWSRTSRPGELGLFPFATNTASGYFCLDHRLTATNPPVVLVDFNYDLNEAPAILPVAPDFPTLLDNLHD